MSSLARAVAATNAEDLGEERLSPPKVAESREARRRSVEEVLPSKKDHPRIAILGSVEFLNDSGALCDEIGAALGRQLPHACILTGANAAVHERVSRAFLNEVGSTAQIFHLAPEGYVCNWNFGTCLEAGRDSLERRYILATLSDVCISVEGGAGTSDEMQIAVRAGKVVIPLVKSGGASGGMFDAPVISRPPFVDEATWSLLQDKTASVEETAKAVGDLVQAALQAKAKGTPRPTAQIDWGRPVANALDITYQQRPKLPEDCPGYVKPRLAGCAHRVFCGQDFQREGDASLGDIYLGRQAAAADWDELEKFNIGGIVNCTNTFPCHFQGRLKYCSVAVNDECGADILASLDGATTFMHGLIVKGINLLVHCEMGISRSSTVVISYLIRYWKMTRDEAYMHVKTKRLRANPNPGFWDQLAKFEERCRDDDAEGQEQSRTIEFDLPWAKESNALFATCHECPEVMLESPLFQCLQELADEGTKGEVLAVCLDYLWGRGLLEIDLDWLRFVCELLDKNGHGRANASSAVEEMLRNEDSSFCSIWAGEIYEPQIQNVIKKLTLL